jgi:hypothetical protein
MRPHKFVRPGAEATLWEVTVTAPISYLLTSLARAELSVHNGALESLVTVVAENGVFKAEFRFVSETGAQFFVERAKQVPGLFNIGSPCRRGKAA